MVEAVVALECYMAQFETHLASGSGGVIGLKGAVIGAATTILGSTITAPIVATSLIWSLTKLGF